MSGIMQAKFRGVFLGWLLVVAGSLGLGCLGPSPASAANFYSAISPANVPWPGGVVPYEFTNSLTVVQQQTYLDGLREWELAANVRFVPRTSQARWVLFAYNTNGLDHVSSGYSPQLVTVSSLSRAQVCHEMGHSLGFAHENIRADQSSYLLVLTNNVVNPTGNLVWFAADPNSVSYGPYDFESVLHLGWDFDSIAPGTLPTQQPKPPYDVRYRFRLGNLALSPGDRAGLRFLYGPPATPLTNVVSTTADAGPGSLRAAMYYAADHPGATVRFNIPASDPGYSNGVFTIHLTGHLPPLSSDGMVLDGSTQPGYSGRPLILVDGSGILPETFTSNSGLLIYSGNNQIQALAFTGFNWNGLTLRYADAQSNRITGCWLGLDGTGARAAGNAFQGLLISDGAQGNIIGGTNALARNVFSGNVQYGVFITDSNTAANVVSGNFIGTDATGSQAVGNALGGAILLNGAHHNLLGGGSFSAGNVVSGNTNFGIWVGGTGTDSNTVSGNWVGLDAGGKQALPNTFAGMYVLDGAQHTLVSSNVFSGQPSEGLRLAGAGTAWNRVEANLFGTDATGSNAVPNGFAGLTLFAGASSNWVGGSGAASGNLVSGNGSYGVVLGDAGTEANWIEDNRIGTDITGSNALGNAFANVALWNGAAGNSIGAPGHGNRIAYAGGSGVVLYDDGTIHNSVRGNSVFGNGWLGIDLGGDGVTLNHSGTAPPGPNGWQNFPVLTNAVGRGGNTSIGGTLNGVAGRAYALDFYASPSADPSGYGQGRTYVGSVEIMSDGGGAAGFGVTVAGNWSGQFLAATATDAVNGDTSEFSADLLATNGPPPPEFAGSLALTGSGFSVQLCLTAGQPYRVQASTNLAEGASAWLDLTNFIAATTNVLFQDAAATHYRARFYRIVSP
jgi:hypothetical protein